MGVMEEIVYSEFLLAVLKGHCDQLRFRCLLNSSEAKLRKWRSCKGGGGKCFVVVTL